MKHKCFIIKTASVRQIRLAFPSVLKAVQEGETIAITSRRKIFATLGPPPAATAKKRPWADLESRLAAQPERDKLNSAELLWTDRNDLR